MVTIIGLLLVVSCAGQSPAAANRDSPPVPLHTGLKFQQELERALSSSWANVELRSLVIRLSSERRIAILLDRRVDPSALVSLNIVNQPLDESLRNLARGFQAEISLPDNVVFLGPPPATRRLRTVIDVRSAELQSKSNGMRDSRRNELSRRHTITWEDLTTPAEILRLIADPYQLTIRNPDVIPHDLWAGNTIPGVTASEALSLVLIQFDLTFQWIEAGQGIELIPLPERVFVEKKFRPKGRAADAARQVTQQLPELEVQVEGAELIARGSLEDLESVNAILNPGSARRPAAAPPPTPLRQRTFTLTAENLPVRAVMSRLEASGVVFEFDSDALAAAGVDLDRMIDLKLEKATADELLHALFDPLKLSFQIDNRTVRLSVKK